MHLILDENGNPVPHHDHHDPLELGDRAVRIGIGGPVGSGKTAIVASLCRALGQELKIGVVTNDIYTTEDADFLKREGVLDEQRIVAVETGCCPHTAIRDDISMNLDALERLEHELGGDVDLLLIESGGDNLTAIFSRGLVDRQIFVLDTAGGDDVPRKGGPSVRDADLLVINKIDLAPLVGSDLDLMRSDAAERRGTKPTIFASHAGGASEAEIVEWVRMQVPVRTKG